MTYTLLGLTVLLFSLGLAGYHYEKRAARRDFERLQPPGRRIRVGDHALYLLAMGNRRPGHPLVILESGHGDWSRVWAKVQPGIAEYSRVVAYDRAGFGWSDPGPRPRTPLRIVTELHELLEQAGEQPPYLLVGHSMGGPLSRLFFSRYPQEVAGMVWVDSAHEDLPRYIPFWKSAMVNFLIFIRLAALLSRLGVVRLAGRRLILAAYPSVRDPQAQAELVAQTVPPKLFDTLIDETRQMVQSQNWSDAPTSLGDLPVTSIEVQYPSEAPPRYPPKQWAEFRAGWQAIHQDLSNLSTSLRRIPALTGHVVMAEQPHLVIQAVREMLEKVAVTKPQAPFASSGAVGSSSTGLSTTME